MCRHLGSNNISAPRTELRRYYHIARYAARSITIFITGKIKYQIRLPASVKINFIPRLFPQEPKIMITVAKRRTGIIYYALALQIFIVSVPVNAGTKFVRMGNIFEDINFSSIDSTVSDGTFFHPVRQKPEGIPQPICIISFKSYMVKTVGLLVCLC